MSASSESGRISIPETILQIFNRSIRKNVAIPEEISECCSWIDRSPPTDEQENAMKEFCRLRTTDPRLRIGPWRAHEVDQKHWLTEKQTGVVLSKMVGGGADKAVVPALICNISCSSLFLEVIDSFAICFAGQNPNAVPYAYEAFATGRARQGGFLFGLRCILAVVFGNFWPLWARYSVVVDAFMVFGRGYRSKSTTDTILWEWIRGKGRGGGRSLFAEQAVLQLEYALQIKIPFVAFGLAMKKVVLEYARKKGLEVRVFRSLHSRTLKITSGLYKVGNEYMGFSRHLTANGSGDEQGQVAVLFGAFATVQALFPDLGSKETLELIAGPFDYEEICDLDLVFDKRTSDEVLMEDDEGMEEIGEEEGAEDIGFARVPENTESPNRERPLPPTTSKFFRSLLSEKHFLDTVQQFSSFDLLHQHVLDVNTRERSRGDYEVVDNWMRTKKRPLSSFRLEEISKENEENILRIAKLASDGHRRGRRQRAGHVQAGSKRPRPDSEKSDEEPAPKEKRHTGLSPNSGRSFAQPPPKKMRCPICFTDIPSEFFFKHRRQCFAKYQEKMEKN